MKGLMIELQDLCKEKGYLDCSNCVIKVESDDKAKIPFGFPVRPIYSLGRPLSKFIVRAQRLIGGSLEIQQEESLDQSFHLGYITPSVNLFQDIPEKMDQSWVRGNVCVALNDSVFESSNR